MAHAWIHRLQNARSLEIVELDREPRGFVLVGGQAVLRRRNGQLGDQPLLVPDQAAGPSPVWILLSSQQHPVLVNGMTLAHTGIHVLEDRDEVRLEDGTRLFFSTERLARVEPFPGAEEVVYCPRCKKAVELETPAVRCPQCAVWYHQTDDRPCWTYAKACVLCPRTTDLNAGYSWTPQDL